MEDIASNLGISISTVSRTIKNKYVQTPTKTYPLKNLLCQSVQKDGVSKDYVKELIKTLIDTENKSKPLSDEKIKTRLKNIGITIQRRTIQKYREEMGFLPSFKRK